MSVGAVGYGLVQESVSTRRWGAAEAEVQKVDGLIGGYRSDYDARIADLKRNKEVGDQLTAAAAARDYWPEIYQAISAVLPGEPGADRDTPLNERDEVRIKGITFEKLDDVSTWYTALEPAAKQNMTFGTDAAAPPPDPDADPNAAPIEGEAAAGGPSGPGYVVTLTGKHYHDRGGPETRSVGYLRNTVLPNLRKWTVKTEAGEIPVAKLGISHPTVLPITPETELYDPTGKLGSIRVPSGRGRFQGGSPGFGGYEEDEYEASSPYDDSSSSGFGRVADRSGRTPASAWINCPTKPCRSWRRSPCTPSRFSSCGRRRPPPNGRRRRPPRARPPPTDRPPPTVQSPPTPAERRSAKTAGRKPVDGRPVPPAQPAPHPAPPRRRTPPWTSSNRSSPIVSGSSWGSP